MIGSLSFRFLTLLCFARIPMDLRLLERVTDSTSFLSRADGIPGSLEAQIERRPWTIALAPGSNPILSELAKNHWSCFFDMKRR